MLVYVAIVSCRILWQILVTKSAKSENINGAWCLWWESFSHKGSDMAADEVYFSKHGAVPAAAFKDKKRLSNTFFIRLRVKQNWKLPLLSSSSSSEWAEGTWPRSPNAKQLVWWFSWVRTGTRNVVLASTHMHSLSCNLLQFWLLPPVVLLVLVVETIAAVVLLVIVVVAAASSVVVAVVLILVLVVVVVCCCLLLVACVCWFVGCCL